MSSELLEHIMDLKEKVARIDTRTERMEKTNDDHNARIGVLEHAHTRSTTRMSMAVTLGSIIGGLVSWVVSHFPRLTQ